MIAEALQAQSAAFELCIRERDEETAKSVLHDDFALILIHPAPAVMGRVRWLEVLREYVVHQYEVQHQHLDARQLCRAAIKMIDQASRRCHQDLNARAQCARGRSLSKLILN